MNISINRSRIESWLHGKLMEYGVSKNVYAGSLPSVLGDGLREMALIDVVDARDVSEYGRVRGEATVNVLFYAAPNSSGRKAVAVIDKAESALADFVENDRDDHYSVVELYGDCGYDKDIGYHYIVSALKVQIF